MAADEAAVRQAVMAAAMICSIGRRKGSNTSSPMLRQTAICTKTNSTDIIMLTQRFDPYTASLE